MKLWQDLPRDDRSYVAVALVIQQLLLFFRLESFDLEVLKTRWCSTCGKGVVKDYKFVVKCLYYINILL